MNHPLVHDLSTKYGPPRIDLRTAWIMDSHGNASGATRAMHHRSPDDVSRDDLEFYGAVYAFMDFYDLLFYLYPVAREFEQDTSLECIDSFLYSLNGHVPSESIPLPAEDRQGLLEGLAWVWGAAPRNGVWVQCPNLQSAIGVSVTWEDAGDGPEERHE